jgi:adenylylsulfate kinase
MLVRDTAARSIAKTVSWRLVATLTTAVIVWALTRRMEFALLVGGLDTTLKLVFYFFHERLWDRIRYGRKPVKPAVIWFTGLSKSGKTAISSCLAKELDRKGVKVEYLNGETVRDLFPETGFSPAERDEHVKRVGYLASRLEKNGVFVVASFVSPSAASREFVRRLCGTFVEIHVATPLDECERRDKKGLYARARAGELRHVVGIDESYDTPQAPDLTFDIRSTSPEQASDAVLKRLNHHF